jgi:hypothetical protein
MKTGGVIHKKGLEPVFTPIQSQGFNPQYMQIVGIMQQSLTDMLGGANSQGLKESSAESGRAVALRQEQGKLVAFLFLDNLTRYKEAKGNKLLSLIKKHDTTERIIKILGGDLDQSMMMFLQQSGSLQQSQTSGNAFLTVNRGVTSFQNSDLDLVVDTSPMNAYERASKLDQYAVAEQNMPSLVNSPTWQMQKLDLLDVPKMDRIKIMNEMAQFQEQQLALQQAEINNQRADSINKVSNSK